MIELESAHDTIADHVVDFYSYDDTTMPSIFLYQAFATLIMSVMVMDATILSTPGELTAKNLSERSGCYVKSSAVIRKERTEPNTHTVTSHERPINPEIAEFHKTLDSVQLTANIPSWDREFCGDNLTLQSNNRSVSKKSSIFFNAVQSAEACSTYSVQVVKGQYIMIGFAPRLGFQKNNINFGKCGWFLYVASGTIWAQDDIRAVDYGTPIPAGSVVTAIHDSNRHQIEFEVDGESLGIAFTNVPHDELFAAADLWGAEDAEIRIINGKL